MSFTVRTSSNIIFSFLILILSNLSNQFQSESVVDTNNITNVIRLNETSPSIDRFARSQPGKLPLEAVEESTEEIRRKTSTTTSTPSLVERSIHSSSFDLDENSSDVRAELVRNLRSDRSSIYFGKTCRKDAHCVDKELICVENRCRPTLDTILNKYGYKGKCGPKTLEKVNPTSTAKTDVNPSKTTSTPTKKGRGKSRGESSRGGDITIYAPLHIGDLATGGGGSAPNINVVRQK